MARAAQSRNGFFGFLTDKKVTYHRAVGKERQERKAEALADRKERLALQELRAKEKAAEAKIAAAERKIEQARDTIKTAETKESKGGMTEAKLEQIKAHMQREIEAQQRHKLQVQGKNPGFGFGVYTGAGFATRQLAHFKSKAAAETWARSHGIKSYAIKRAFDKSNPARSAAHCKQKNSTGGTKARKPCGQKNRGSSKKKGRRNPAADAAALSAKFHGRKATSQKRIVEPMHEHKQLMEIGPLVRLVVDTPTNKVAVLNFNTSDPKKIVYLSSSEKDPKTGKIVGKQLYLRGGDQEVNLKGLGMDSALWIRDKMELGRLHEFKRGDPKLIVDGEEVKGSITYRTRKGMDDFKLIDYWHRSGEETSRKAGPAARPLVIYDYRNRKIEIAGGQYSIAEPGIMN